MLSLLVAPALGFAPATDTTVVGSANNKLGYFLTTGDFDGDGYDDLAGSGVNHVEVFEGSAAGLSTVASWTGGAWGSLVALDANGDGYDDLVVTRSNRVALYLGSPAGLATVTAWSYTLVNYSRLAAGDVNGDGMDDLVYADPEDSYNYHIGHLRVFHGTVGGLAPQPVRDWTGDYTFGATVAVSDVNGDGYGDVVSGNPYKGNSGSLWIYAGSAQGVPAARTWTVTGGNPAGQELAEVMTGGADLNGDGYGDLAVSSWVNGLTRFSLVYGGPLGPGAPMPVLVSPAVDLSLAMVGDLDGDGEDELVAGWADVDIAGGVYRGGAGLFRSGTVIPGAGRDRTTGSVARDHAGSAVTGGDYNGDGTNDWALGAYGSENDAGSIGVMYGP